MGKHAALKPGAPRHAKPGPAQVMPVPGKAKTVPRHAAPPRQPVPGGALDSNMGNSVTSSNGPRPGERLSGLGSGLAQNARPEGTGPIVPIMVTVFAVIAVAKMRSMDGTEKINVPRALFGGFLCTFLLMALYKANTKLGTGFAVLVLMMTFLKYGPALTGLATGESMPVSPMAVDVVGFDPGKYSNAQGGLGYSIDVPRSEAEKKTAGNKTMPTLSDVLGKKK